jgi:non-specific protein-tyrosine kinase
LIALDPRALASQDYRLLGAQLSAGTGPKTVLITSPQRGDGKTTTVANLALTLAEAGKSVIAVDANFLRPRLHSLFALANDEGVLDVLCNGSTAVGDRLAQLTWTERLRVLPTGSLNGNVRAPIAWPRMAQVLADLQQRADVVLIDSPALLESADAALLATHIDDTIVVVDATRTKTTVLAAAQALLVRTGASIRGLLLNKVASQDRV